jgi:CheY-like chemotaxis protein
MINEYATVLRPSRPFLGKWNMARILVVDDEPLIAAMAQEWLEEMGHVAVGPAYDIEAALALAEDRLDAAILDLSLGPNKSYGVAHRLRERDVPFAFATGYALDESDPEHRGVVQLQKPFEFETFRTLVETLLASAAP